MFFLKWEATKNIALRNYIFLMGGDTKTKRKTHTHDNFIVLVVRDFSFGGGMVHAYCRSVAIFSSDLQKFCYVNRHERQNTCAIPHKKHMNYAANDQSICIYVARGHLN